MVFQVAGFQLCQLLFGLFRPQAERISAKGGVLLRKERKPEQWVKRAASKDTEYQLEESKKKKKTASCLWWKRRRLDGGCTFQLTVCLGGLAGNSAGALGLAGQPCHCQSDGTCHRKVPPWANLHQQSEAALMCRWDTEMLVPHDLIDFSYVVMCLPGHKSTCIRASSSLKDVRVHQGTKEKRPANESLNINWAVLNETS